MIEQQVFRPTQMYWLKTWLPFLIAWLVILVLGMQQIMNTEKFDNALSFAIFSCLFLFALMSAIYRKQFIVTSQGLFVQTVRKSYYWSWEQITAVHIYATGKESKPMLFLSTEEENYRFEIHAFDEAELEDAITAQIGQDMVGVGAYRETEKYQKAKEDKEHNLQLHGESKKYVGGAVNNLLYIYALILGGTPAGIGLMFAVAENWVFSILFLALAPVGFLRPLLLAGDFYMNRDHIVCRRPWQTHMMWWRDVEQVEVSLRTIVFRGSDKCLVCPGLLFWRKQSAQKLLFIFSRQIEERQIYARPRDFFSLPRNKNVKTNRFKKKK